MDKMNWGSLLSSKRYGLEALSENKKHDRTEFQRDFDRLIFSAPFRRLQNKTQVFPLPGSVFVHNRLTHSLEVSSVGRSLGANVGKVLKDKYKDEEWRKMFYECGSIVAAACLAHDLGNPPFGHSGEKAIGTYFSEGNGRKFEDVVSDDEWQDFIHFEGNANSFRLLDSQWIWTSKSGLILARTVTRRFFSTVSISKTCLRRVKRAVNCSSSSVRRLRTSGRIAAAKWASTRASSLSVLANSPLARAYCLTRAGFTTATDSPA